MRAIRSRRLARCAGCGLTDTLCICGLLKPIALRTRVVIVAHRDEVEKTSNTGRLAVGLLDGAKIVVRGRGPHERERVHAPTSEGDARRLLLYPAEGARTLDTSDGAGEPVVLVVPDGSWSQARKVHRREPLARGAEAVALPPGPPSRYVLRHSESIERISTIEAIARALRILEGPIAGPAIEAHLLAVFETFVDRTAAIRRDGGASWE